MEFVTLNRPTNEKRIRGVEDGIERFLKEPVVMLIMAKWLIRQGAKEIRIHPDGNHLKQFDMRMWLESEGFAKVSSKGKTDAGGIYQKHDITIELFPKSGLGDVTGKVDGQHVEIETKGGCINSRHAGQLSILRSHLNEAVGQLMSNVGGLEQRLIAVVPYHKETYRLASKMISRCGRVGIEIALVKEDGNIMFV